MALSTTFNRLKREIGIKKCVIVEGNVGDVYLNEKKQIVDLKQYLMDMLKAMDYDDVLYWDRIDGVDGDVSRLDVVDKVEVEGDDYSFDDDEEETPKEEQKTGSGLFKEPAEIFNIIFKNLTKPNKKIAFVLNWADYLFSAGGQLPPDERELLTLLGKAIKDKKVDYLSSEVNESTVVLITSKLSMFPISFYQGNPEVACLTLSRPDREEREKMLEKIESGFEVKLKPGESLLTCDKKNEYIDMLDDFTKNLAQNLTEEGQARGNNKKNIEEYYDSSSEEEKETSTGVEAKKAEEAGRLAAARAATLARRRKFYDSLIPFVERYGKEMIRAFYDYWSELNKSRTKMRFETEKTWELPRRLATWSNREKKSTTRKPNFATHDNNKQYTDF